MCSFDINVLPLYPFGQHVGQNQRHKKSMINILFFVFKAACPDEEDKFQTIRKLRLWGKFQPYPSWLSYSTVWHFPKKTGWGIPVSQPSFYRIEQIPGRRGPAPVLEQSGLFKSSVFCKSRDWEAFAGKDSRQGPFNFWDRLRGNRHCKPQTFTLQLQCYFFNIINNKKTQHCMLFQTLMSWFYYCCH